jgi:hypothetical protein
MPQDIEIIKTLVIGLGTTGTKVCRRIAERVEWEYGGVERAPWIRYLCLETDGNTARGPLPDEAMVNLSITPEEYAQILKFSSAYDEFMNLECWADEETLKCIPHGEVSSGAGNIRMVGRLALLFPRNYRVVRNAIEVNMRALRLLDSTTAQEKLGKMPDGTTPTIGFRGGNSLRIFVTGSLCGGTCSGIAADVGYVVGHIKHPDDKSLAVLGLPRPDLSNNLVPHAERLKVNAYAALAELNHYSLPQIEKPPIKAGADVIETTGVSPYDVMYIAMPEATGAEAEERLIMAMADRVFLNSSVPDVDPFGNLVDATIVDRKGHAHVFCTFGIRTIEFPRQRVIEGCTKKLLLSALRLWGKRDSAEQIHAEAESAVRAAGFQTQAIESELRKTDKGQDIQRVLDDMLHKMARAKTKAEARDTLDCLRSLLGTGPAVTLDGGLRPGDIPRWIQGRIETVATDRKERLHSLLDGELLKPQGLLRAAEVLSAAQAALEKLAQMKPVDTKTERKATDDALEAVVDGRWWWPPSRRKYAENRAKLVAALREELDVTLDSLTRSAIAAAGHGVSHRDCLVSRCRQSIKPIQVRLDHLRQRVTYTTTRLDQEVVALSKTAPTLNGEALFSTGQWEGTIGYWYQHELGGLKGDETRWEQAQADESAEVLSQWTELPRALRPGSEPDWLADDVDPEAPDLIPRPFMARLLDRARQPFDRLRQRSVTEELLQLTNMRDLVRQACERTRELVLVDDALATQGGRSPIPAMVRLLRPDNGAQIDSIAQAATSDDLRTVTSPDTSRILILRERYRFPLYGAPRIVSDSSSLAQATSGDFSSFHTRKDVYWTGLSEEEHSKQLEAEEVLVVAVLLGVAALEAGRIWVRVHCKKLGDPERIALPFSIAHAARMLNPYRPGALGGGTSSPLLAQLTDQVKHQQETQDPEQFVRNLVKAYKEDGAGQQLPDWGEFAGDAVRRYCARDNDLYIAYRTVFPPSADRIARMFKRAGDTWTGFGGTYTYRRDGLYCLRPNCGGWVGADEKEAAMFGWRCSICGMDCEQY